MFPVHLYVSETYCTVGDLIDYTSILYMRIIDLCAKPNSTHDNKMHNTHMLRTHLHTHVQSRKYACGGGNKKYGPPC